MPPTKHKPTVHVLSPSKALDFVTENYAVLLAFASTDDFMKVWNVAATKLALLGIPVVLVEPSEASAVELQLAKHPTYTLYRNGNENWVEIGNVNCIDRLDTM